MTDHVRHTEGPLVLGKMGVIKGGPVHEFTNGSGQSQLFMAMAGLEMSHQEREANGAHLVKCWNMHYGLLGVLRASREAMAGYLKDHPHHAPNDCYATGPLTGNPMHDLVRCPGCTAEKAMKDAVAQIDELLAQAE
ncbi:hypothetical protein [Burkholderia anthina]|uniref:hypothetical protein n=1 Tax=Burkholderia anthina TaxID=179879 RepID=UPI001588AC5B|nr:hypothetical protein [Burkholderia anthina]